MITIFTPSYNRAYILPALYDSLKAQTCKDFEWIIVDDGSSDNTDELVAAWLAETAFPVRYVRQKNGGKHTAINRGVQLAQGEFFFIVDSDDVLPPDSIERIVKHCEDIKDDASFGGVCGLRAYFNGERIGGECDFGAMDCTSLDFRFKYCIQGDMAEVIRTSVFKEFPFPEIEGERFCPEALVFNRIATKYKLRYFYEKVYLCEYLQDGLTASIVKVRMNSPIASTTYYAELFHLNVPFKQKVKAAINYWRFAFCQNASLAQKVKAIGASSLLVYPIAYMFHLKDLRS